MSEDKLTRELWMNLEAAYTKFHQEVAEFIHKAKYPIASLNRDLSGKISSAIITMPGGGRIIFGFGEWEVRLPAKDNPLNMDLLTQWERQELDNEIEYHTKQLAMLKQRKSDIDNGINTKPLLQSCNWSVKTKLVLINFCIQNDVSYDTITIDEFVSKFRRIDLIKTRNCGRVTIGEIVDVLEAVGYKLE